MSEICESCGNEFLDYDDYDSHDCKPKYDTSKTCLDCVEFTWNWQRFNGCVGSGHKSIKPCFKFIQITKEQAETRLKILGAPGVL